MTGPDLLIEHLREQLYHPRSDAHSNAICRGVLQDLIENCEVFKERALEGRVVAKANHTVMVSHQSWNIDLAIGPPPEKPVPPSDGTIRFDSPTAVEIAIEAKGIMTEHGKARRNRLRDFHAFHSHAHQYNQKTIACGTVVVNMSSTYWSPTRDPDDLSAHPNSARLAADTIDIFRSLPLRNQPSDPPGMEAFCAILIEHDNLAKNLALDEKTRRSAKTRLVTGSPAPAVGDPLHYSSFIYRICTAYRERWGT